MVAWLALQRELSFFIPLQMTWPFPGIIFFVLRLVQTFYSHRRRVPGAGRWYTVWTSCFQVLELFAKADNCLGNVQHNLQLLDESWLILCTLLVILEFCIPLYHYLISPYCSVAGITGCSFSDLLFLHYRFVLFSSMQISWCTKFFCSQVLWIVWVFKAGMEYHCLGLGLRVPKSGCLYIYT